MIDEIRVTNLALIKDASIRPSSGLTVITGETGTGKTALLSSCKLLMGQRADKTLVREGEEDAKVQGRLFLDSAADSKGNISDTSFEGEVVISRQVSSDGRSRVQVNGGMVSVGELASLAAPHIDLCSQHDQQKLLKPSEQKILLDSWIGKECSDALELYQEAYRSAQEAAHRLEEIRERRLTSDGSVEDAKFLLSEIEAINPEENEYEDLLRMLDKAENAEALATQSQTAYEAMAGEDGILDRLNIAMSALDGAAKYDPKLSGYAESLREAGFIIEDVARDVASYKESMEFDPETLAESQEKVAAYQRVMRKYGPTLDDVFKRAAEASRVIEIAENADEVEKQALAEVEMAEALLAEKAHVLTSIRAGASGAFASAVCSVMADLEMGSSSLDCQVVDLARDQWNTTGPDRVEFMFRPSKNMQSRPLSRIASGGELSRVMLSLHAVMGDKDSVSTLIFDEIDAGVGGKTAVALADVLGRLAQTHQVIAVTHLAQVAAKADKHYVVDKREVKGMVETSLDAVSDNARVEELARMLSGSVTELSVAHATELLRA